MVPEGKTVERKAPAIFIVRALGSYPSLLPSGLKTASCSYHRRYRNCTGSCVKTLADCHRRWGFAPRPEERLYSIRHHYRHNLFCVKIIRKTISCSLGKPEIRKSAHLRALRACTKHLYRSTNTGKIQMKRPLPRWIFQSFAEPVYRGRNLSKIRRSYFSLQRSNSPWFEIVQPAVHG